MPRAFMMWPRIVKEHLPYYLENETPKEFDVLLHKKLYNLIGKQVFLTKGFSNRKEIKSKLLNESKTAKIPWLIRFFLSLLVVFPFSYLHKFYAYYIVPFCTKKYA